MQSHLLSEFPSLDAFKNAVNAFLNAGLSITLADYRDDENPVEEVYCYHGGLSSFVTFETESAENCTVEIFY